MIGTAHIIEGDLFCIVDRLREIDSTYFVVDNYIKKRLELHCSSQRGDSLTLVLPFRTLDERTIRFVRQTRSERKKRFLEEMEKENERLEKERAFKVLKNAERELENQLGKC